MQFVRVIDLVFRCLNLKFISRIEHLFTYIRVESTMSLRSGGGGGMRGFFLILFFTLLMRLRTWWISLHFFDRGWFNNFWFYLFALFFPLFYLTLLFLLSFLFFFGKITITFLLSYLLTLFKRFSFL